jgi:enoyl-CoA hydratase/carnithine racemase
LRASQAAIALENAHLYRDVAEREKKQAATFIGRGRALEVLLGCDDFSAELAEHYGYINRALPADELTPFVERLAHRIASFPAHTVAHVKAAVDLGAFGSLAEGLLVEAHESDLSVASEVTQARVAEALKVGAETYEGELEMDFLSRLSPNLSP